MPALPKLSVRLHGGMTPAQCVEQAVAAEAAGMHGIWFAENPFNRGTLPAAAACAVATKRIKIGAGVFNPYNRHPTLIAMEIGALDELAAGRVRLGIGSGIGFAIERMGFSYNKPVATVREAVTIVRALLRGEEVTRKGIFNVNKVKLDYKARADIPIFTTGRGTRSLETCGELADGLIVSNMVTAAFAGSAMKVAQNAARRAGRALSDAVQYMPCVPKPDRDEAYRLAKQAVGEMVPAYWTLAQRLPAAKAALMDGSGIPEADFAAAANRIKAGEPAVSVLDERFVRAFSVAGNADDCRALAASYAACGVTELALTFTGPTAATDMKYLAGALAGY